MSMEVPSMTSGRGKVLVTGANGFIGRRLTRALVEQGEEVRCLLRRDAPELQAEKVIGDLLDPGSLDPAFSGIDTAYYLVHSMAGGRSGFERRDRDAATNFVRAAERAKVRRVIYL